tara:strand:+ start:915 stop:1544 length:630 start_codon:yes stop_codon:yes gene_type:complete
MSFNFVEKHEKEITLLNKKVADAIEGLKIDSSGSLSIGKCISIVGEINKAIKNIKSLATAISEVEAGDKAGVILSVTITTLNSDDVRKVLPEEHIKVVEDFCQDSETVETVVGLVDFIADEVLVHMDKNKDGIVTDEEVEDTCIDICLSRNSCGQGPEGCGCYQEGACCSCCVPFSKSFSSCWSSFFLKFLCCSNKKSVQYEETEFSKI